MPLSLSRLYLGFKGPVNGLFGRMCARLELAAGILLEVLLGDAGALHEELYEEGLITDTLSWSVICDRTVAFAMVGGETPDPSKLQARVLRALEDALECGPPAEDVRRVQRRLLGDFVRSFDSLEACCWNLVEAHHRRIDFFAFPGLVEGLDAAALRRLAPEILDLGRMTAVTIRPVEP